MKNDRKVFLVGFMGCGKTYWGSRIAASTDFPFYDLDTLIESRTSRNVTTLFQQFGEDAFRTMERETLHHCQTLEAAIIATGGGTPCFFDNMAWMNAAGRTIYIKTPPALLALRLQQERQFRPLLAQVEAHALEAHIEQLLAHRAPFYEQADIMVEQSGDESHFFEQLLAAVRMTI